MSDSTLKDESLAGDENILICGNNLGPKVERLADLSADPEVVGKIMIPAGVGIGSDVDISTWKIPEQIPRNQPILVRSSATDEDAGTGIYSSIFLFPRNGIVDEARIKKAVYDVRGSLSNNPSASGSTNMGVLVQPVVGDTCDGYFTPAISGVLTMSDDGHPIVRFAIGLGTRVVQGREAAIMDVNYMPQEEIVRTLQDFNSADVLVESTDNISPVQEIRVDELLRTAAQNSIPKLLDLIAFWNSRGRSEYWEFAISSNEDLPCVVQTHPNISEGVIPTEFEPQVGKILFEGTDTVNFGTKQGELVIILSHSHNGGVSENDLTRLEVINKDSQQFLLVAPDTVFSDLSNALEFKHFSNALGVVEMQHKSEQGIGTTDPYSFTIDHTTGRGGTHFSGMCKTKGILFLSTERIDWMGALGSPTEELGDSIAVYEVPFKAQNTSMGGRVEIIGEPLQPEYRRKELDEWADMFWIYANFGEASGAFFKMLDLLLDDMKGTVTGVNLYSWKGDSVKSVDAMLTNIDIALRNLYLTPQYEAYQNELEFAEDYPEYTNEDDEPIVFRLEEYLKRYKSELEAKN